MKKNQPIGLFDSGVGGLTVANAIKQVLPNENMIYFGDTFHLPYGDKSREAVQFYSKRITDFLLEKDCKVILIACNSASSNAYEVVKNHVGDKAIVINVIDPVVDFVTSQNDFKRIGVIGTKLTINSGTYANRIQNISPEIVVKSLATPLLVPMIEEGFIYDEVSNSIIKSYLSKGELNDIEALILGCTHYPIIRNQIIKYYNFNVQVIDSAKIVALKVQQILMEKGLLSDNKTSLFSKFFISDYTDYFKLIARMFFERDVNLETLNFWK
jgi:glutamate racemase